MSPVSGEVLRKVQGAMASGVGVRGGEQEGAVGGSSSHVCPYFSSGRRESKSLLVRVLGFRIATCKPARRTRSPWGPPRLRRAPLPARHAGLGRTPVPPVPDAHRQERRLRTHGVRQVRAVLPLGGRRARGRVPARFVPVLVFSLLARGRRQQDRPRAER